jgi:hypothetical protein
MKSRHAVASLAVLLLSSCMSPPKPAPKRASVAVAASFGRTWDATLNLFASRRIQVVSKDRKEGTITTEAVVLGNPDTTWADCGKSGVQNKVLHPELGRATAKVQGDSTASEIHVSVMWLSSAGQVVAECSSSGKWESAFESEVKRRAEHGGRAPAQRTSDRMQ